MRSLHVIASLATTDGGPATACLALVRAQHALGDDVRIVTTEFDGYRAALSPEERREILASAEGIGIYPRSRPYRLKNSWRLGRAVLRQARHTDVIHLHGLYLAHSVWAFLGAVIWRRPLIVQPHGVLEPYQRRFGRLHKGIWDWVIGRWILRRAALLVAASDSERSNLLALLPASSVVVMPLGVAERDPEPPSEEVREALAPWLAAAPTERVLFLGRLARKKQPDLLVRAWSRLPTGVLAIVGPEEDFTARDLQRLADDSGAARVVVLPTVPPAVADWLLDQAAVFVLPSLNENFALAVAEAMGHRCAVITSADTAAGDHVARAGAGVVLAEVDQASLADAITAMLADPAGTARMAEAGRHYASDHLTWDAAARILSESTSRICVR